MSTLAIVKSAMRGLPQFAKSIAIISGAALKKNAPKILLIGGTAAIVGGTIVACKKTLEMPAIIDEVKAKSKDIHDGVGTVEVISPVTGDTRLYSEEDAKQDLTRLYISTAGKIIKVYWLAALLISAGTVCVGVSNGILSKRLNDTTKKLVAVTAAYEGLSKSYEQYRRRVIDAEGADKDAEYFYGNTDSNDIHHEVSENVQQLHDKLAGVDPGNPRLRVFDEVSSRFWTSVPIYNVCKVKEAQHLAWIRMKNRYNDLGYGFMFLWEVELELGLVPTASSYKEGWLYNPHLGEEQISFGLEKGGPGYENKVRFLNCKECDVCLEFNCTEISDILADSMLTDAYMERMNY